MFGVVLDLPSSVQVLATGRTERLRDELNRLFEVAKLSVSALCLSISISGGPISRYVEPLWTIDHAARYLRCSPRIVLRYARRAGLPYMRLRSGVRLIPSEVRRWAEARKEAR